MEIEEFWRLIESSPLRARTQDERTKRLVRDLSALPPDEIVSFQAHKDRLLRRADKHETLAAHCLIMGGGGGGDAYFYFLHWLIGLGQDTYERIVTDAEALLTVPELPQPLGGRALWPAWPEWEGLLSAAPEAYATRLGFDLGKGPDPRDLTNSLEDPDTQGDWDSYDLREVARRLPRLFAAARPGLDAWYLSKLTNAG
jgi:hypothetical protein